MVRKLSVIILALSLLSACLYPQEQRRDNQVSNDEQLDRVQQAVDSYREQENGLLPIETRDQDTPLFIKYPIDFTPLMEQNIIGEVPSNSFQEGGYYSYVIVDPEESAEVKVADARVTQTLRSVNYEIHTYRNENGHPPYGETIGDGVFTINEEHVDTVDGLTVNSPYSNQQLDVVMTTQADVLVDYRPDVYRLLEEENIDEYEGDLRYLLLEHYPIVPAYSPEMYLENGNVVLQQPSNPSSNDDNET
ncbi:hypothetical protein ABID56_000421 [Alkalibacillus flavidus]|uniref:Uncharacterized protein n=1 Tax=Alkalibacillus flavidus TaxID=546021 RepID=A0ABV2KRY3_9BACI